MTEKQTMTPEVFNTLQAKLLKEFKKAGNTVYWKEEHNISNQANLLQAISGLIALEAYRVQSNHKDYKPLELK